MTTDNLNKLIGLVDLKQQVSIQIAACKKRGTVYPNSILWGIGGTGKSSVARSIALDLDYHLVEVEGATFKHRTDLFERLNEALKQSREHNKRLLFFIDEIHRLSVLLQEALYFPMKENKIEGKKIDAFCLFAATTRLDLLDAGSFVSRFRNVWQIDRYGERYIQQIIADELRKQKVFFNPYAIIDLSKRCLGIPRIAVNLTHKVTDYLLAKEIGKLDVQHVDEICRLEGIDGIGLNRMHREYLMALFDIDKPIGLGTIASKLGVNKDTVSGSVEPILLAMGLVIPTARGRQITDKGRKHLVDVGGVVSVC